MSLFADLGINEADTEPELDERELAWRAVEEAIIEYVNSIDGDVVVDVPHFALIVDERAYDDEGDLVEAEAYCHTPLDQPAWITEKLCSDAAEAHRRDRLD